MKLAIEMNLQITTLACGSSGTGFSALVSVEAADRSGASGAEPLILSRCLVNVGDSTQRICMDAKVKMSKVSGVIITSLAPHNVSGLAGLILCLSDLGVGKLKLVGPPGLEGYVAAMAPFTNRRYPELVIIEVADEELNNVDISDYFSVRVLPVKAAGTSSTVALSAVLKLRRTQKNNEGHLSSLSVLSYASNFQTSPSLAEQSAWSGPQRVCTLFPTSAHCHTGSEDLQRVCTLGEGSVGILFSLSLHDEDCEVGKAQEVLAAMKALCPNLFGPPLPPVQENVLELLSEASHKVEQEQSEVESRKDGNGDSNDHDPNMEKEKKNSDSSEAVNERILLKGIDAVLGSESNYQDKNQDKDRNKNQDKDQNNNQDHTEHPNNTLLFARPRLCLRALARNGDANGLISPFIVSNSQQVDRLPAIIAAKGIRSVSHLASHLIPQIAIQANADMDVGYQGGISNQGLTAQQLTELSRLSKKRARSSDCSISISISESNGNGEMKNSMAVATAANTAVTRERLKNKTEKAEKCMVLREVPERVLDELEVCFLGTGSATPSRFRNSSGILLQVPESSSADSGQKSGQGVEVGVEVEKHGVLLDVGEGTCSQLFQALGGDVPTFERTLCNLRLVWISHHHADHICGLPMLLQHIFRARAKAKQSAGNSKNPQNLQKQKLQKLCVVAPPAVLKYYEYAACISGLEDQLHFLPINSTTFAGSEREIQRLTGGTVMKLVSVPVLHCKQSYGAVLSLRGGKRVVYSGDCRPSDSLVAAGRGCDLLIHEATFGDCRAEDASKKRHCTTSEAAGVGRRMRAKHTVLTHFSQRYASPSSSPVDAPVAVAPAPVSISHASSKTERGESQGASDDGPTHHFNPPPPPPPPPRQPLTIAQDFLRFSFPSQMAALPAATGSFAELLRRDHEEEKEKQEEEKQDDGKERDKEEAQNDEEIDIDDL